MADISSQIIDRIEAARRDAEPLSIVAGASKRFVGRASEGSPLDVAAHSGIVSYEPGELVLTVRGGTPLLDIEAALDEHGQMLPFEPPRFGGSATIGGTLACNASGPARPWSGAVRDAVLGVELITGRGEQLNYGGRVMKNVAGFDVSRLQAGALGAFGVISRVSLKVLPRPQRTLTLVQELDAAQAIVRMNELAGLAKPLSGAAWCDGRVYLRLSGAATAVEAAARQWGGSRLDAAASFWRDLADQRLPFFRSDAPLWRFSVKSSSTLPAIGGEWLIDWGGAQRWIHGDFDRSALERLAESAGGHASLYRGGDRAGEVNHELPEALKALHLRLKNAFDPDRILNPGRLYSWM